MKMTRKKRIIIGLLLIFLMVNYMVVTIILKDSSAFKYIRDILLLVLVGCVIGSIRCKMTRQWYVVALVFFGFFFLIGVLQTDSVKEIIVVGRRYLFPLLVFFFAINLNVNGKEEKIFKFLLIFTALLSLFGIIQVYIFGDSFLEKLGYPMSYSPYYKRNFLGNSFYFGGLGIQRVVSTLSSANICGLILGLVFVYSLVCHKVFVKRKYKVLLYLIILLGYLLTFSRSNFLALFFVLVFLIWKYIPYKKYILLGLMLAALAFVAVSIIQGSGGIAYRIFRWVIDSFQAKDTSAAGRGGIWLEAFNQVKISPLGIGFGHVGGVAGFGSSKELYFSAENSYLAIALETGWGGLISYIAFLIGIVLYLFDYSRRCKREGDYKGNRLCVAGYTTAIYLMIVMFFSNHIHDMEAMALAYFLIGISISYVRRNRVMRGKNNE